MGKNPLKDLQAFPRQKTVQLLEIETKPSLHFPTPRPKSAPPMFQISYTCSAFAMKIMLWHLLQIDPNKVPNSQRCHIALPAMPMICTSICWGSRGSIRSTWLAFLAAQASRRPVLLNVSEFVAMEDKPQCHSVLQRPKKSAWNPGFGWHPDEKTSTTQWTPKTNIENNPRNINKPIRDCLQYPNCVKLRFHTARHFWLPWSVRQGPPSSLDRWYAPSHPK